MIDFILNELDSPLIIGLTILYFIFASITTFGIRITQAKRNGTWPKNEPDLPNWTTIFYWFEWSILFYITIFNWKFAIALFILKFILKVLPVLEIVGNLLMRPFRK
ncbi:hypothetical protein G1K73_13100 [Tenacibaculum finnmarkense]|uniref:hypothetical protein n=1 Tax=Tenacibaculum finnmarkense TaxID=2781243 RepID=UPI001EFA679E|nr:hypothetical protein [Tenacibaculum finnmarkense]MCG8894679.1 hypothetical protein [Tenacibaculum finnmarkense]